MTVARLLICVLTMAAVHASGQSLQTTAAVRGLSRDEAMRGLPVRVQGVVTYAVRNSINGFILESNGVGIWVGGFEHVPNGGLRSWSQHRAEADGKDPWEFTQGLMEAFRTVAVGQRLEIEGITVPGGYAPCIAAMKIHILGKETPPDAPPFDLGKWLTNTLDCQRVQLDGVIHGIKRNAETPVTSVTLAVPGAQIRWEVQEAGSVLDEKLIGALVRVNAMGFTFFNERSESLGPYLQSPDASGLTVLTPAPDDPFDVPELRIAQLLPFSIHGPVLSRQMLSGTVTLFRPYEYVMLENSGRTVRVNTTSSGPFSPGDVVQASGFVEIRQQFAELSGAELRRIGSSPEPVPVQLTVNDVLKRVDTGHSQSRLLDFQGRLVQISGNLQLNEVQIDRSRHLICASGEQSFTALIDAENDSALFANLQVGSALRLKGICEISYRLPMPAQQSGQPVALALRLRGVDDLEVIRSAPWWTPHRLLILLFATCLAFLAVFLWATQMRRVVGQRSKALAEEISTRKQAEIVFEATLLERKRMAADLHDGMEQTLNGLALQFQAAIRFLVSDPQRSKHHLELSLNFLDSSREELRRSVWNLRAEGMNGQTLPEALEDAVLGWLDGHQAELQMADDGVPLVLPDWITGNLLLLAGEAVTNALKHGRASHITISTASHDGGVSLAIMDNGIGFDPHKAPGSLQGHFGLQGMRERMNRLGGSFLLESKPGRGTRIEISLSADACCPHQS